MAVPRRHSQIHESDDELETGHFAMTTLPLLSADALDARVPIADAITAVQGALRDGHVAAKDPTHTVVPVSSGALHLLPAEAFGFVGAKVLGIAPDNPRRRLERTQGVYVLMDAETLTPKLVLDGAQLTQLRTAALSAASVDRLADPRASRLTVFGSGTSARRHIEAMMAIRPIEHVVIIARDGYKAEGLAAWSVERGLQARIGQARPAAVAVPESDIIVCATSSQEPVFDGSLVAPESVVVAVGSVDDQHRELDAGLLGRSDVYVEDRATALHEAGDVIMGIAEGPLEAVDLREVAALERGEAPRTPGRPAVVKTVGMGWQDLVVAIAAERANSRASRERSRQPSHGGIGRSHRAYARV